MRVVAGAKASIAFDRGSTNYDVAEYPTDGNGNCSFRVVASVPGLFDVSFSYPFVDISHLAVQRRRGNQTTLLTGSLLRRPPQSPSSLYFAQLTNDDVITVGTLSSNAPAFPPNALLTYDENYNQSRTNGLFVSVPMTGSYLLPEDWTDGHSFAGLVPGLRWSCGVPYFQRLHATTNLTQISPPGAYAMLIAFSPPEDQALTTAPRLLLDDGSALNLSGNPAPGWRAWPMVFDRVVLLDYAVVPSGRTVRQVDPSGAAVMGVTAFTGDQSSWLPIQNTLSNASLVFITEEQQRERATSLRTAFGKLPNGKIALLPLNTSGAGANFAALTGLNLKWAALTESQLVDSNYFSAARFPLAIYLGSENYVKTVSSTGDAKASITRYLAQGGTLILLPTGPFPFYYGYGPNDQAGAADPLLPALGLQIYNAFEQPPAGLSVVVSTNQSILSSVPQVFPFPPGDGRLRSINRSQLAGSHRYVPWLTVTNSAGLSYGDAACFIEFGTGAAKGGKVLYI
ncbi:MAG: hypothetical protein ACREIC_16640, partial [Limisphaerales bacterium]